ncbi:Rv3235 family protein [Streptomyces sp. NPDC014995]|uniref:Rv3235 family protein n=1 Tax=Streptomyces sp. NPDC014995 TaxID=3364936 RepID=UPI0036F75259
MNKVMTRAQHTPGTRPPGRRDTRRPTGTPPRTTPHGSRPPGTPGSSPRTRPTDNRPATTSTPTAAPRTTPRPSSPTVAGRRPPAQPPHPHPRPTDLFADRLLAVLSGQRPVHSMLRHTLGRAYDDLAHLAERGPLRTTRGTRPVIRDIGYDMPRPGAIEAFARIGAGDRLRAMAFRLELGTDHRWRCTAVELGGPRRPPMTED